jgi:hypothetical protein
MQQDDLSRQSLDPPDGPSSLSQLPTLAGDFLLTLGGVHAATTRRVSPPHEVEYRQWAGFLLLLTMMTTASTFTTVLHFAVGDGEFHIPFVLVGLLVAALQGTSDNLLQYRKPILERGCAELTWVGMRLPRIVKRSWTTLVQNLVRVFQGGGIGALAGFCFVAVVIQPSVHVYQLKDFLTQNPTAAVEAARQIDQTISQTADEYKASTARTEQINRMLTDLRQNNVRRATRGSTRALAVSSEAVEKQIKDLESSLAVETATRNASAGKLDKQRANRNADIERTMRSMPGVTPMLSGLAGQLEAIAALAKNDWKLIVFIVVFQAISLALELSPMWVSLSDRFYPSAYAAHVAMEAFLYAKRIQDEGALKLGLRPLEPPIDLAPPIAPADDTPDLFERRGPGRPKGSKNKKPNGDGSEMPHE